MKHCRKHIDEWVEKHEDIYGAIVLVSLFIFFYLTLRIGALLATILDYFITK